MKNLFTLRTEHNQLLRSFESADNLFDAVHAGAQYRQGLSLGERDLFDQMIIREFINDPFSFKQFYGIALAGVAPLPQTRELLVQKLERIGHTGVPDDLVRVILKSLGDLKDVRSWKHILPFVGTLENAYAVYALARIDFARATPYFATLRETIDLGRILFRRLESEGPAQLEKDIAYFLRDNVQPEFLERSVTKAYDLYQSPQGEHV